jgi:phytoene/squalene synthetase
MLRKTDLPVLFLDRLLDAFLYDVNHRIFRTWENLFQYCSMSAQPIGHIILWLHGRYTEPFIRKSNAITTALQMANFWQDISVDRGKNRIYIPLEVLREFGLTEKTLFDSMQNPAKDNLILFLTYITKRLMLEGQGIWKYVPIRLRYELQLTFWGGMRILERVEKLKSKVFETRPVLTAFDWLYNLFRLG